MKIAENGAWLNETKEGHCFDPALAFNIMQFCHAKQLDSVLDLGCGDGSYVNYFNNESFSILAVGCDGNPNTQVIANTDQRLKSCFTADLSKPLSFSKPFDSGLVLSLEVGEHIPVRFEEVYLDNVLKYAREWIILSWAIPGQDGDGHVNCRSNDYIEKKMSRRRYELHDLFTGIFRDKASLPWFKDTLMVFSKSA